MTEQEQASIVKFMRLNNGEDIISEVIMEDNFIVLINPLKILYTTSAKPGFLSISLMQWVFTKISLENIFEMPKNAILLSSDPTDGLLDYYWQTVLHFQSKSEEHGKRVGFVEGDRIPELDDEIDQEEGEDALKMLEKLLESFKPNKGTLH
jgi:hypothetical protein